MNLLKAALDHIGKHPLLYLALTAGAALIGGAVARDGLFGQTTAAWVQAVGSIGAILGAVWIAGQQAVRQRGDAFQADLQKLEIGLFVSQQVLDAISASEKELEDETYGFALANFDSVSEALAEVQLMEMVTGRAAIALINQRRNMRFYKEAYNNATSWAQAARHRTNALAAGQELMAVTRELELATLRQHQLSLGEARNAMAKHSDGARRAHEVIEAEIESLIARHKSAVD